MKFGTRKPRRRTHASTGCKIRACYPYLQDTVSKLLASFFKEDKTRRELDIHLEISDITQSGLCVCVFFFFFFFLLLFLDKSTVLSPISDSVTVGGDATLLMADMLKIFVQGKNWCVAQLNTESSIMRLLICRLILFPRGCCEVTETSRIWGLWPSRHRALRKDPTTAGEFPPPKII